MTFALTYTLDPNDLKGVAEACALTAKQLQAQVRGAINTVASQAVKSIREQVAAYVTLPKSSINPRIEIVKRASQNDLTAIVKLDRRSRGGGQTGNARPTLMSFGGAPRTPRKEAKRTRKGKLSKSGRKAFEPFTYQILKAGGRRRLPGGFVQRATRRFNLQKGAIDPLSDPSKPQAFQRRGPERYPLTVPRGPSISAIWQSEQNNINERSIGDIRRDMVTTLRERANRVYTESYRKVSSN